ncbi:MAG: sigma-70 family RNA polymerase sigma factor [Pseudomonadota bacterium]
MDAGPDLNALLLAVARGDRGAFRALYDRQGAKLFGVALRICRDERIAEEALQEALVDIWRNAGRFDPARGSAAAWTATVTRNRAVDAVRRRGRPALGGEAGEAAMAAAADPAQPVDGGADRLALSACLDTLEARSREAVVLAYLEGLSREELSIRYDAPVNTVKTWLRRGLAALKDCLER